MKHRTISHRLLAFALLSAMTHLACAEVLFKEDFESEALLPDMELSQPKGGTSAEITEIPQTSPENEQVGKRALKLTDTADGSIPSWTPGARISFPAAVSGEHLRISFDYFVQEGSEGPNCLVDLGDKNSEKRLLRLLLSGQQISATKNSRNEGKKISEEAFPGTWHRVVLEFSVEPSEEGFSVSVNGNTVQGLPYWESASPGSFEGINTLSFADDGIENDVVWIDNILIERME